MPSEKLVSETKSVNQRTPLQFHKVTPIFRSSSAPEKVIGTDSRVIRSSPSYAGTRVIDFLPVVNNPTKGVVTNDKEEVGKNEIGQTSNNEQDKHGAANGSKHSSDSVELQPPTRKAESNSPRSSQPKGTRSFPRRVPALSLLLICEHTPRSPR